jgi:hypothetical protein
VIGERPSRSALVHSSTLAARALLAGVVIEAEHGAAPNLG